MNLEVAYPGRADALMVQPAARQAALLLHGMGEEDRAWMLAALPPERRVMLEDLLAELRALGIPCDRTLCAPGYMASGEPAAGEPAQELAALAPHQLAALAQCLKDEPASLTAGLLQIRAWPWQRQLLDMLDSRQRRQVSDRLTALAAAPEAVALNAALAAVVARRLRQAGGLDQQTLPPDLPRRLLEALRQLRMHLMPRRKRTGRSA